MPTFAEQQLNPNKDPFFGHEDLHLGHKIPLVERDDIRDGAITSEKIADEAVTAEKIAPGAVGHEQLAPEAITDLSRLESELQGLVEEARNAAGDALAAAAAITGDLYRELVGDLTDADIERWFYGPDEEE